MTAEEQKNRKDAIRINPLDLVLLTHQTRNLLAFHKELGIVDYPAGQGTADFLVSRNPVAQCGGVLPVQKSTSASSGSHKVSAGSRSRQLEVLVREYASCRSCGSGARIRVPGQGSLAPQLFVVGDFPGKDTDGDGILWGAEEDILFWKMMAAIGLDREAVFVSNCIKCRRNGAGKMDKETAGHCFSFLERELILLQPEVICTMGELATSLVLKHSAPLVRIRGRFHQYRYPHGTKARVMPTFHPRLLLKHPEMKQAAWMDLQAVRRVLPA